MSDISDDFYGDPIIEDARKDEKINYEKEAKKLEAKANRYEKLLPLACFIGIKAKWLREEITIRKFRDLVVDKVIKSIKKDNYIYPFFDKTKHKKCNCFICRHVRAIEKVGKKYKIKKEILDEIEKIHADYLVVLLNEVEELELQNLELERSK